MKSKRIFTIIFMILEFLLYTTSSYGFERIIESDPSQAVISNNNSCLLIESVENKLSQNSAIKLPADINVQSVRIISNGVEIKNIVIEKISSFEAVTFEENNSGIITAKKQEKEIIDHYLLSLEPRTGAISDFTLKYIVTGINWIPSLTANIIGNQVDLRFDAIISNSSVNLKATEVTLVSTPLERFEKSTSKRTYYYDKHATRNRPGKYSPIIQKPLSKRDQVEYKLGKITVPKNIKTNLLANISTSKNNKLESIYVWQTDDSFVQNIISTVNPFTFPVCTTKNTIIYKNTVIDESTTNWSGPGDLLFLYEDVEKNISCNSSVEVVEDLEKKKRARKYSHDPVDSLYYNHAYEFACINESDTDETVEIVFKKKYGRYGKTIYNFDKEPTKSPSWWHVWQIKLEKGLSYLLKFNLDTDTETFKEYKKYRKAVEGC